MISWRERWRAGVPRVAVIVHDLAMVWLVWQGLQRLRFAVVPNPPTIALWSNEIAVVMIAQGLVFWQAGLYRGLWRFAGQNLHHRRG